MPARPTAPTAPTSPISPISPTYRTRRTIIALTAAAGLALAASGALAQGPLHDPFPAQVSPFDLDGQIGLTLRGVDGLSTGRSVAPAGDVNGDGVDDVVIGSAWRGPGGSDAFGKGYVVFGRAGSTGLPADFDLDSLDGTNGFRFNGSDAQGEAGYTVASAGDLNNDGIDDIVIGAPGVRTGGGIQAGECYVIFGRDTATGGAFPAVIELADLDGTNGFRLESAQGINSAGAALAPAGDVNGDGVDDLIIGATGVLPSSHHRGMAIVVFGRDSTAGAAFPAALALAELDGTDGFRMTGSEPFERCGISVAGLGDVNGDGLDDLIVGAPHASDLRGHAYVVFGRDAAAGAGFPAQVALGELDGTDGFRLVGEDGYFAKAGWAVSSAGDINGDGTADLAVGSPGFGASPAFNTGKTYVVFGRPEGGFSAQLDLGTIIGESGFTLTTTEQRAESGTSLAPAGDINGDGFDDLIVGAPHSGFYDGGYHSYSNYGASYVVFGRETSAFPDELQMRELDGSDGFGMYGLYDGDWLGVSVAAAGDLNGDGRDDVIIGARGAKSFSGRGEAYVIYGRGAVCRADLDGDGELTIFDFLAFQNLFDAGDLRADFDGDGELTIFDFLAFQNAFDAGCP